MRQSGPKSQQHSSARSEKMDQFLAKLQTGDFVGAIKLGTRLADKSKADATLLNYLGIAHAQLGQFDQAIRRFTLASRIKPDFAWAHNNLGSALRNLGKLDEARDAISAALKIQPDYAEAHNNLGNVMTDFEDFDAAVTHYSAAISAEPTYQRAHLNLCEVLEKTNRIDAFVAAVAAAQKQCQPNDPRLCLYRGKLASREKDFETARDHLQKISISNNPPEIAIPASELLGKALDRLGDYDAAFASFQAMTQRTIEMIGSDESRQSVYINKISRLKQLWQSNDPVTFPALSVPQNLAFLIGFPRSGTTLLDTILRGHPEIMVIEEQPFLNDVVAGLDQSPEGLAALPDATITELQGAYLGKIEVDAGTPIAGKLVVDKFPLNIEHVPVIQRLFPEAKIIFALRDPADCILSCFMQNFELNTAMASFLSIDRAGKTYDEVMQLWTCYETRLAIEAHYLKYEDLVTDMPGTIKPLLAYLGLEWVEAMANHQRTATKRKSINTPSYDQVTQPLYSQAMQRWRCYEKNLASILPITRKWAKHWKYPV